MARPVVKINRAAVRKLLKDQALLADLERRAAKIAAAAGPGFESDGRIGRTRARAMAYTTDAQSMRAEATDRALTRAIDAGRG